MLDQATYTPRLKSLYADSIRAAMKEEFSFKNDMQIPRLDKIVLNMGVGEAVKDTKKKSKTPLTSSRSSPVKRLSSPTRKSRLQASASGKKCRWAAKSRCVATGCSNSSTV